MHWWEESEAELEPESWHNNHFGFCVALCGSGLETVVCSYTWNNYNNNNFCVDSNLFGKMENVIVHTMSIIYMNSKLIDEVWNINQYI